MVIVRDDQDSSKSIIKLIPLNLEEAKIQQEARAVSALDHANICVIHEIDEIPTGREQMFICMAYYDGETLEKKVASGQSREAGSRSAGLSVDRAIDIASQIAQGLIKAHEHGIFHQDIKPGNIMITKDGFDFECRT